MRHRAGVASLASACCLRGETFAGRTRRPIGLVAQIALSLVLLFLAGSFLQGVRDLQSIDPDSPRTGASMLTCASVDRADGRRRLALYRSGGRPHENASRTPDAALASSLPLMPTPTICASTMAGLQLEATTNDVAGYLDVMGIHLVSGREFRDFDAAGAAGEPVMVSETFAGAPAGWRRLGERVLLGCGSWLAADTSPRAATVIGVARDTAVGAVGDTGQPHVYRQFTPQDATALTAILIDAGTGVGALVPRVHDTLLETAPASATTPSNRSTCTFGSPTPNFSGSRDWSPPSGDSHCSWPP